MEQPDWASVFEEAKLTTVDVARILDVSRVSVSLWKGGRSVSKALQTRVSMFIGLVKSALSRGLLPLSDFDRKQKSEERVNLIRKALRAVK